MTEAQNRFQKDHCPYYSFGLDQTALWEDMDYRAVEIQKDFPTEPAIDIMIPGWRKWLIPSQNIAQDEQQALIQAISDTYGIELSRVMHVLSISSLSYDDQLNACCNAMEAAMHYHAKTTEFFLNHKSLFIQKSTKEKLLKQTIKEFKTTRNTIVCGEILIKIAMYGDFLLQNFAHKDEDENQLSLNYHTIQDLSSLKWQVEQLYKKLRGMVNQNKSKNNFRQIKEIAYQIWREHNLGRDEHAISELKRLYKERTGKELNRTNLTILTHWIPMWSK